MPAPKWVGHEPVTLSKLFLFSEKRFERFYLWSFFIFIGPLMQVQDTTVLNLGGIIASMNWSLHFIFTQSSPFSTEFNGSFAWQFTFTLYCKYFEVCTSIKSMNKYKQIGDLEWRLQHWIDCIWLGLLCSSILAVKLATIACTNL